MYIQEYSIEKIVQFLVGSVRKIFKIYFISNRVIFNYLNFDEYGLKNNNFYFIMKFLRDVDSHIDLLLKEI